MKRTYEAWAAFVTNGGYNRSPNKHKAGRLGLVHCTDISFKKRLKGMRLMESLWGKSKSGPEYCKMDPPRPGYSAFDTWHINLLMGYYKTKGIAVSASARMPLTGNEKDHAVKFAKEYFAAKEEPPIQASLPFQKTEKELADYEVKKGVDALPIVPFYFLREKLGDVGIGYTQKFLKWANALDLSVPTLVKAFEVFMAIHPVLSQSETERVLASVINEKPVGSA